jgi:hypothetical protein
VDVVKAFPFEKAIRFAAQHRYQGNSYNLLEGYKYGVQMAKQNGSELIYLIEEDIWIAKDFFTFHEKVQKQHPNFCVSAVRNQNNPNKLSHEPGSVYYYPTYQSLGVSFKVDRIESIVKHATPEFYRHMLAYVRRHFPKSRYGGSWCEQDGLINRIVETSPVQCMYPYVPRAFHAGFVGYNRQGKSLEGSLEMRVSKLKSMTDSEMNEMAKEYKDITSIPLHQSYDIDTFEIKGNGQ